MKAILITILFTALLITFSNQSYSQFAIGQKTGSLSIGFDGGGLTGTGAVPISAEFNFLSFEKNINAGVFVAYSSSTYAAYAYEWKYTDVIIAAQGNWHFLPGEKWDPFAGLSLGYDIRSHSGPTYSFYSPTSSGFFISVQGGVNYWFSPEWAIQGRLGYFPYFSVGVTHTFN
ncbi:MAG: hypothetical protein P4L27_05540 [Ignavibacteriaceae bacterium]|nr:hypothetical protein [Ignavibacteriaceae bacterium]